MTPRWLGLAIAALLVGAPATAHLRFPKLKGERSIEIALNEDPIRIRYRIGLGASLADAERGHADRDDQFGVSAAEGNAALDEHTDALLGALTVCTGRTLDAVACRKLRRRDVERVEAQGWVPGPARHLHFAWTLRLRERAGDIGALRLEDDYQPPGLEITDVSIVPPRGVELTRAGDGALGSTGVTAAFSWIEARRSPGPRVIVAAWPPPPADRRALLLLALAAAGALLAIVLLRRHRAR